MLIVHQYDKNPNGIIARKLSCRVCVLLSIITIATGGTMANSKNDRISLARVEYDVFVGNGRENNNGTTTTACCNNMPSTGLVPDRSRTDGFVRRPRSGLGSEYRRRRPKRYWTSVTTGGERKRRTFTYVFFSADGRVVTGSTRSLLSRNTDFSIDYGRSALW